jgi:hypothetical protein
VVGHRLTLSPILFFHVVGEHLCQQVEKVGAAVECAHFYLVELLVDVVFGYLHIEGFCQLHDYVLYGQAVAEAFGEVEGVADLDERHFLVAPFQSYVLKKLVIGCRHDCDFLEVADCLADEVESLADEGCQRAVHGVALGLGLEVGDFNLYHEQCADGIAFVPVGTAHLEYLNDEVSVCDVKILVLASGQLAEEFSFGKGEYVHIVAGGLSGST